MSGRLTISIKATPERYDAITGVAHSERAVWKSAALLLASGVAHEFRTTLHPHLHSEADILQLAKGLQTLGVRNYALQVFRSTGCADTALCDASTAGYPGETLVAQVAAKFPSFALRTH